MTEPAATQQPPVIDAGPDRGLLSRLLRGVWGFSLVVATLLIGQTFIGLVPDKDTSERPFLRSGKLGELIDGRTFDAEVVGVRGAATLAGRPFIHDTQGVWVIVRVRVIAREEPIMLGYAALTDQDERFFRASDRFTQPFLGKKLQPGIPVEGEIAFEVPKNSKQLSVRLAESSLDLRMDAMVDVPLPIGDLTNWATATDPVKLTETEVVS